MAVNNLLEIIKFILEELDRNGNPDIVQTKFNISNNKYQEITDAMKADGYIKCDKIYMDGSLDLDHAVITNKGYQLIR